MQPYIFFVQASFTVTVLDQKLIVRSEADSSYVDEVAGFVNQKIRDVMDKAKSASSLHAALLACMNVANELFQMREEAKKVRKKVAEEVRGLIREIDAERQQVL